MEAVLGLFLLLLSVSHGMENVCDGRQNGAQCYGALGGTLVLQLMDKLSGWFQFRNSTALLVEFKEQDKHGQIQNKYVFTPHDGTVRINNLRRTDSDKYQIRLYNENGEVIDTRTFKIHVEAPVSSVSFSTECLSQGEMKVSCTSQGGDSPQYSWTLDGRPLTGVELLSGNTLNENITLKQHVRGSLQCSVSNNVSSIPYTKQISTCGFVFINCTLNDTLISKWVYEANNTLCKPTTTTAVTTLGKTTMSLNPSTNITNSNQTSSALAWFTSNWPAMVGVLAALILLLLVGLCVVVTHRKKTNNGGQSTDGADNQELTYADVTVFQRRQEKPKPEDTVVYGQVFFTEKPRRTAKPVQDECIYSNVMAKPRQHPR